MAQGTYTPGTRIPVFEPEKIAETRPDAILILPWNLARWSAEEIEAVAATLNNRPRKTLDWKTPAEALNEYLLSSQQQSVATTG